MKTYRVIGLMSGSSLDGLDVAFCTFSNTKDNWKYSIVHGKTYDFPKEIKKSLSSTPKLSGFELIKINKDFGKFSAKCINEFCDKNAINKEAVDAIASHGHTVFHRPELGFTTQIGCGATINALTGIQTVCDFRSVDVALGGQGAPLVPIGDELLFSEYDACLNLGGIANISYKQNDKRIAYDICITNIAFNHLTKRYFNCDYDNQGNLAKNGRLIETLLNKLDNLEYYKKSYPKSLGKEDFEKEVQPLLTQLPIDSLRTLYEHFSNIIAKELDPFSSTLITGGGAYNTFFIDLIREKTQSKIVIPDDNTIQFKEALIFAFLGLLRIKNLENSLKSVTGASRNSIGGAVYNS